MTFHRGVESICAFAARNAEMIAEVEHSSGAAEAPEHQVDQRAAPVETAIARSRATC
jgi:hypothetical protein